MSPSSTLRRVVRVALVSITFGAAVGAIAVLAVVPHSDRGERALNIIFADQMAAGSAHAAPAAKLSLPSAPTAGAIAVALQKAEESPAASAGRAATAEEPKVVPKKKKKKMAQRRERRRDDGDADSRDRGELAAAYGRRPEGTRDGGW